jgi:uncharacterized delta-60 repeat protein
MQDYVTRHRTVPSVLIILVSALAILLPLLRPSHSRASGGMDPGFGDGGVVVTNLNGSDFSFAIALQSDGKIVTAGSSNFGFMLVRYNTDGTLDPSFGSGGSLVSYFGAYNLAYGVAVQPDGKILAAGYLQNSADGSPDFQVTPLVARYNPDGTPDPSFGGGGITVVGPGPVESAKSLAIQPDGKIIVAGNKMSSAGIMRAPSQFVVSRLNPTGTLDPSFGSSGKTTTSFDQVDFLNRVLLQSDGKIIAVGETGASDMGETDGKSVALARYNPDGSLDAGFGTRGKVVTSTSDGAVGYAAALQPDGKLVVAGADGSHLFLARYNANGSLDSSFGAAGLVSSIAGEAYSVVVDPTGKIVVGGSASGPAGDQFAIVRFNPDGSPDSSFGANGVAAMDLGFSETGRAVALDPTGRIIMAGYLQKDPSSTDGTRLGLLAYQPANTNRCMRGADPGQYVVFNPDGHYKFALCGKQDMTLSGTGAVSTDGTTLTITDRQSDRMVKIVFDTGASTGKAKIKMIMPDGIVPFSIKSTNPNAVCSCAAR